MKRWILALVFFWGIATAFWIGVPAIATEEEATEPHDHIVTAWVGSDSNHSGSCNLCGEIITQSHKLDSGSVTTPATCQGPGIMTYACTLCDYTSTTEIPATSHSYGSWSKVDSTYHQHSCACGATVTEKHTWNNGMVTTKATCSRTGVRTYTCTGCGATKTAEIAKLAHTYSNSCDVTCNVCGAIRRTEHKYETSWSADFTYHWHECTVCGDNGDQEEHIPSDWIIDLPEGEFSDGEKHQECTVCGVLLTIQTIPATGCLHGNEELLGVKEPTCVEEGYTGDWTCPRCYEITEAGEVIPMLPHETQLQNQADPTCTQKGYTGDYICRNCHNVQIPGEDIPKLPHNTQLENVVEPTCTTVGYSGDYICVDCHRTTITGEEVAKLPHDAELKNARNPGCTVSGYTGDLICNDCHNVVEPGTDIPATGHQYYAGFCMGCMAEDPDHVVPDTTPEPEPPAPALSPMIVGCVVALGLAAIGIMLMVVLLVKKQ